MKERLDWQPRGADFFTPYIYRVNSPLDASQLNLDLLIGDERQVLRTPVTGSYTFALRYKGYEGAVTSLGEKETDLVVLQLQGAKSRKSYRVSSGMDWVHLFANEVKSFAEHPLLHFRRLIMPMPSAIEGLSEELARRENAEAKYLKFVVKAGLRPSYVESAYIRDVRQK